ncbi:RNA ligase [Candidatus Micrarchaeota archaeon]|nr:RNA ligase [Candidatus Micrarchaeota archaeon]
MDVQLVRDALKRGKAQRLKEDLDYIRFRESFRGVERGTVIIGKKIVWGYPHIKRIFTLKNGLEKNLPETTLYAEEKIDGFNVRVASINGKLYGFSRGGFLDSFVTEKIRELDLAKFFKEYEQHVLCAEMLGNTPYTAPSKDFDVKLFVFDIDDGTGQHIPCDQKYKFYKEYSIDHPPLLGKFQTSDYEGLRKLILSLDKGNREGMVLKTEDRKKLVKYVTPNSDIHDVSEASLNFFDMPIGFFYQRVLRSAFFVDDFSLDKDKYALKLGQAFYKGLTKALHQAKKGGEITEEFEILIKNRGIWDDIQKHMSKEVKIEELWRHEEKGKIRIRFQKIYKKTTKKLVSYAAGKGVTD